MATNDKKKSKGLGLPQTKGSFQIRGIVKGVEKDNFYKESKTKETNTPMRRVNFGVDINKDQTVYVELMGMKRDKVFFSKSTGEGKDRKTETEEVSWNNRFDFKKDGFKLIGTNVGIVKTKDDNGNEVNDKKTMVEFDACEYIGENLKDDMSVFVKGSLDYSTYNGKHYTKYIINQLSLCQKAIDFEDEKFAVTGNFEQTIVIMGVEKNDNEFVVSAKIVGFNSIEDTEFIVRDEKLAKNLRKLKPYTAIKVFGNIEVQNNADLIEEEDDDGWGTPNPMKKISNPTIRLLVITGADKETIDDTIYNEETISNALAKIKVNKTADKDYGDGDDDDGWGNASIKSSNEDDDPDEW